ncbi:MAG: 3-deoxy-8-phosphooctulonate synthase [Gammaproteobacteria bacterium]
MTKKIEPKLPPFFGGLFLIAGPCAIESRAMLMQTAESLQKMCAARNLPLILKSSFDKANRTSADGARGAGMIEGLDILAEAKAAFGLPVLTDVHLPQQAQKVAEVADVLQIPAFLCRQTDLIEECAKTGKTMLIKKGQFAAPGAMKHAAAKAKASGAADVLLCERGFCFGYGDLVADMRALVQMRAFGYPLVFDAAHAAQKPGGDATTGGAREMVRPLARAAVATGIDGLFVEAHPNPQEAISDRDTQLPLSEMPKLLDEVLALRAAMDTVQADKTQ